MLVRNPCALMHSRPVPSSLSVRRCCGPVCTPLADATVQLKHRQHVACLMSWYSSSSSQCWSTTSGLPWHVRRTLLCFPTVCFRVQTDISVALWPSCVRHVFQRPFFLSLLSFKGVPFVQVLAALFLSRTRCSTAALFSVCSYAEPQEIRLCMNELRPEFSWACRLKLCGTRGRLYN